MCEQQQNNLGISKTSRNELSNQQNLAVNFQQQTGLSTVYGNLSGATAHNIFHHPNSVRDTAIFPPNTTASCIQNPVIFATQSNSIPHNNIFTYSNANMNSYFTPQINNPSFTSHFNNPYSSHSFTSLFNNPYTSQSTQMPSALNFSNLSTSTGDITLSTLHVAARHAISKDLPTFSGKPEDWPIFITNYLQSTERCGFSDQENLIRLQKSLKGAALEAVKGKLMMPSTVNFAIETLRMLYGRPEIIHQALQRNLRNEATVRKERLDTLINFALAVQNYRITMQAMGLSDYLNDPMLLNDLVEKLPSDLKLDWGKYRVTLHKVDIVCFDNWLYNLATCASQVTTFSPCVGEIKHSKKERVLVHDIVNGERSNSQPLLCVKCQSNHRLFECPAFIVLSVNERWNFIRLNNLCLRCFKKHHIKRCKSKRQCGVEDCKMPHNSLLHKHIVKQQQPQQQRNISRQPILFHVKEKILFKYIPVTLFGNGYTLNTYALIDEGASCSLIERDIADQLGLDGPSGELCLQWTGEITQKEDQSKTVVLQISDRNQTSKLLLSNVRTISKLDLPIQTLTTTQINECDHLRGLPIVPYNAAKAKILIGLDNAKLCVPLEIKESPNNELIATRCRTGWGVHGRQQVGTSSKQHLLHICLCNSSYGGLDDMVKQYFSLDAVGVKLNQTPLQSKDDERAKVIMERTTKYLHKEKRWETGLLFKNDAIFLPNAFDMAKRRLICLEGRMQRDEKLKTFIIRKMREYEDNGYIHKLKQSEIGNNSPSWYIPIFTVENKNKNKTRIVWDAAAAVEGVSLNSVLLKGPDLLKSLVGVLIRFRERPIAICGDIREMFHQIRIRKEDHRFQRFLWRWGDSSKPIEVYTMTVMTFGASCSPSLANYIKNKNAERFLDKHYGAVQAILHNTFVDDWLQSTDKEAEMVELAKVVRAIHKDCGFQMRNWLSNSENVLSSLDENNTRCQKIFEDPEGKYEKVLGLLGNFIIYAKVLLQDIWRSGVKWDERIHETECDKWWQWVSKLKGISTVSVPRCHQSASKSTNVQLHIFTDASIDAYAAIAYLRVEYDNQINCSLVASKTRVAPLKPISIPKMELMAALLGLRLSKFCYEETSLKINRRVFWTDSKDVLYWINSDARKFQQFVAVRIGEILEDSDVSEWRWVPSVQNVADDATKWKSPPDLSLNSRWFIGPPFLRSDEDNWPTSDFIPRKGSSEILCHLSSKIPRRTLSLIAAKSSRFSRWEKIRRCEMIVLKFIRKLFRTKKVCGTLKPFREDAGMDGAEFFIYKMCQEETFTEEVEQLETKNYLRKNSNLYKLNPYLDEFGLLRIKGRINAVNGVPVSVKRPIILPGKHVTTNLIIDYFHRKYHHQHNEIVVDEMRQTFWIPGLRAAVRAVAKSCQYCKIRRAVPKPPVMGSLPIERLPTFTRPFYYTGVDYFGPIDIIVGRRKEKRWGVVFTCMTVRAVHLEIAPSLSTDSFLLIVKQFISRRGAPCKILSDNATNFRGASRVLLEEVEKISSSEVERKYPSIDWKFITPAAPHMGGAWERMVRSVKSVLMDILPNKNLREETLRAALADVENILNSRPLTYFPLESSNREALTPNHFLLGSSSGVRERAEAQSSGGVLSKNFRISNMIANEFWKRWIREYLPCLTRRTKWFDNSAHQISVDDIVIIVDDNTKRNEWIKGVVIEVYRGKDQAVRSAVVKTQYGLSTRPVVKLAKLDVKS